MQPQAELAERLPGQTWKKVGLQPANRTCKFQMRDASNRISRDSIGFRDVHFGTCTSLLEFSEVQGVGMGGASAFRLVGYSRIDFWIPNWLDERKTSPFLSLISLFGGKFIIREIWGKLYLGKIYFEWNLIWEKFNLREINFEENLFWGKFNLREI